jgi:hypothetical protein
VFIATMYSFGKDTESVGVDGIVGCMGVFLAFGKNLYAIHVPDTAERFDMGRNAFVTYVKQQAPKFKGGDAKLFCILNGDNRPDAAREMVKYCMDLFVGHYTTVRLRKHLGGQGSSQGSAAVLCELQGTGECRLKYLKADQVNWTKGQGTVRAGYYHNSSMSDVLWTSGAAMNGWRLVDIDNSNITVNHVF